MQGIRKEQRDSPEFEWLANIAAAVDGMLRRPGGMGLFRRMINTWLRDVAMQRNEQKAFRKRRARHFEKKIASDPRLADKSKKAPAKGWRWESYVPPEGPSIEGWVPPGLSIEAEPQAESLASFGRDREPSLQKQYALLAAIHNGVLVGVRKVIRETRTRRGLDLLHSYRIEVHSIADALVRENHESGGAIKVTVERYLSNVRKDFRRHLGDVKIELRKAAAGAISGPAADSSAAAGRAQAMAGATAKRATGKDNELEERSLPFTKTELARRLRGNPDARAREAKQLIASLGPKKVGNLWTVRLDPDLGKEVIKRLTTGKR
jgi:hypothetical protein